MLRAKATALGYSPDALLALAEAFAEKKRWFILPTFAPFPEFVAEHIITPEHLEGWPDWSANLISAGSRIDMLRWPDGTVVVRLLSPRALVLAATVDRPNDPKTNNV